MKLPILIILLLSSCRTEFVTQKGDILIYKNKVRVIKVGEPRVLPKDTILKLDLIYRRVKHI